MERLGNHFADGYLDVDEFSKRAESAASANTRAELQTLFADLPAEVSPESSQGTPANPQHQSVDQELQTLMKKAASSTLLILLQALSYVSLSF